MKQETIDTIIRINNDFYKAVGTSFSNTRQSAWPGWKEVLSYIQIQCPHSGKLLDVACGNGRFLTYLKENNINLDYLGVDSSQELLAIAKQTNPEGNFEYRDLLSDEISLDQEFDVIVSFGFMHHIPSSKLRQKIIAHLYNQLIPNGILILTFWSNPTKSAVIDEQNFTEEIKQLKQDLEPNDYFLGWDNTNAIRFCHLFDETEVDKEIEDLNLKYKAKTTFLSDGKTSEDNIYVMIRKA